MDTKECPGCGNTFTTSDPRKKRCRHNCGRTTGNRARDERRKVEREHRALYFPCGLSRGVWADSAGKCTHCRKLARAVRLMVAAPTEQHREWYQHRIDELNSITPENVREV